MFVESPRSDVSARIGLRVPDLGRTCAIVAGASVLPLAATGNLLVAAVCVGVATGTRAGIAAVLLAATATAVRWGTTSLAAVAGAQDVLGPALLVGSTRDAASAWLAAAAIVLSARVGRDDVAGWLHVVPCALFAANVAIGGDHGIGLVARFSGAVAALALAGGVAQLRLVAGDRQISRAAVAGGGLALIVALS